MGLIKEGNRFAVLTDILGDEDHLGDMDFKVAGTDRGITALADGHQDPGHHQGNHGGRPVAGARRPGCHILGNHAAGTPPHARTETSLHAPRMMTFKINPEKIRDVIGKGGAVIRALTEETGADDRHPGRRLDHHRVGQRRCLQRRAQRIEQITAEVEVGKIYEGPILRLLDFGAIVQLLPGKDGLLHISQIAKDLRQHGLRLPEGGPGRSRQGARGGREGPRAPVDEGCCRGRRETGADVGVDARGVGRCVGQ